jgi:hypothetical protein
MKRIKKFLVTNKIIAVCLTILMTVSFAFASGMFSSTATKQTNCGWYQIRHYFSDASHTRPVGTWRWFCDGLIGKHGQATPYYDEETCECFEEFPE